VFPVLNVLGFKLPTFMTVMVLCYVGALLWSFKWAIRQGLDRQDVIDGCIIGGIVALFGAKFGHLFFEAKGHILPDGTHAAGMWELIKADPWHWARIEDPGYVWYGGALALIPAALWFTASRGVDRGAAADAGAPCIAVGVGIGRLGCFLGGCCFGSPTDVPWAVTFPSGDAARLGPVHPTQLYEAVFGLLLMGWMIWRFPRRKVRGELLAWAVPLYALERFITEFFRGDAERGVHVGMGTSQLISIPVFLIGAVVLVWLLKNGKPASEPLTTPDPVPAAA